MIGLITDISPALWEISAQNNSDLIVQKSYVFFQEMTLNLSPASGSHICSHPFVKWTETVTAGASQLAAIRSFAHTTVSTGIITPAKYMKKYSVWPLCKPNTITCVCLSSHTATHLREPIFITQLAGLKPDGFTMDRENHYINQWWPR